MIGNQHIKMRFYYSDKKFFNVENVFRLRKSK